MIMIESTLKSADNAGAILFKCINVAGGFKRRYARLGELVSAIAKVRRVYDVNLSKKILDKKVKKKRKQKSKKIKKYIKPYYALLVSIKKNTNRYTGEYIKFDQNRALTLEEPIKFGPAGKSSNEYRFMGTRIFGPVCKELYSVPGVKKKFKAVLKKTKIIV